MGDFFRQHRFRILICILALLVGMMLYTVTQGGYAAPGSGLLHTILSPFQGAANHISEKSESLLSSFTQGSRYQTEIEELKAENAELKNELKDFEETKQQLQELQQFMGIKEEHETHTFSAPCTIIGYVTNDPYHSFIINRGSEDGLSLHDPVVTGEGIVGIISTLSSNSATVQTIFSPDLSIGAISADNKYTGIVEGEILLAESYQCRMIYLDRDTTLTEGSLITTSSASGLFPKGYLIGTVESIEPMESGLSKYAVITPAVNFEAMTSVVVITDYPGKGEAHESN
ncbi:MAG: rod shape-determining protein MreC [Ruminococcus sp.]|nr:rod shape-determining protein MreC [Ruminococcus sp.]